MANPEHLEILKKGVEAWNQWRMTAAIEPDLAFANLESENLKAMNLTKAELYGANLTFADLTDADLTGSRLTNVNFSGTELKRVRLCYADLGGANFNSSELSGADFSQAVLGFTIFSNVDLREVIGLDAVQHAASSTIGLDTILNSHGKILEPLLRGAGTPDAIIAALRLWSEGSTEFHSCFISYSTLNQELADRIYNDLQAKGVRCWLATEDLKIGDPFRQRIEESINIHDKLLLLFSEHSVQSPWVQDEVEAALERERRDQRDVLFPIRIDDAVMNTDAAWAASIRRTRHIGDFTRWKDHDEYQKAFERLLRDLKDEPEARDKEAGR